jgi:hypothetical protein
MKQATTICLGVLSAILCLSGAGQGQPAATVQVQGTIRAVNCQAYTLTLQTPSGVTVYRAAASAAVVVNSTGVPFCALQQYLGATANVWLTPTGNEILITHIDAVAQPYQPPAPPPAPTAPAPYGPMTGIWDFTFAVIKGNDIDRRRLGFLQNEYRCAQGGMRLICRSMDGRIVLSGSVGDGVSLALGENVNEGAVSYVNCYRFGCFGGLFSTGYSVAMQLRGRVTEPTYAKGEWNATIKVDFSNYPVEGTWEAIKVQ